MTTKKQRVRKAKRLLETAKEQLGQASVHAWEPAEPAEAVTKCFYSLENALTAAATALGQRWTTKHYEKARLAKRLAADGKLSTDISERLTELNELRKNVQYGEPGAALLEADLEDILGEVEGFLDEVENLIDDTNEK